MKNQSKLWSKIEWKNLFLITGGVLIVFVYCLMINGVHLDSEFEIIRHTPAPAAEVAIRAEVNDDVVSKININTATAKELEEIHGVGDKMAQRIIKYRTERGEFKQIEDIMKISGIGKKTFEGMKDTICVE